MNGYQRFTPLDIGLILSYKCQSACSHCIYNCGPEWNDWITPEDIDAAFDEMLNWNPGYQIHITGGEPFLNFNILIYAVRTAAEKGISCYVETNAGWCLEESLVVQKFKQLKDAGLNGVLISCSPFHAEKIPPIRTFTAINVAYKIFGPHRLMVYRPEWMKIITRYGLDTPVPLEQYIRNLGPKAAGRLFWNGYGIISGGRSGYRLGHLVNRKPARYFENLTCEKDIIFATHIHFDLYGNYISGFCGGISIGDWHDLASLLADLKKNNLPIITSILVNGGPYRLMQYASQEFSYSELEEGYVGKCHLCVDVRRHLAIFNQFSELAPKLFYDLI